jgi:hypothetical protein
LIGAGLVLSLFNGRTPFPTGAQVVNTGIGLFVLLPILRVILMLTIFVKERTYQFAAAAVVVLLTYLQALRSASCPNRFLEFTYIIPTGRANLHRSQIITDL